MEIPDYQPFYLSDLDALRREAARLGIDIPICTDLAHLKTPVEVGGRTSPNRLCALPVAGNDAGEGGVPGDLTSRRYHRAAAGGFGLIWVENTLPGLDARPGQLSLSARNMGAFREWVAAIRAAAAERGEQDPLIILQIDCPVSSDDLEIVRISDLMVETATQARLAGFDGVDVRAGPGSVAGDLLAAGDRAGPFGGAFENRSRFLRETFAGIREREPGLLLALRLTAYNGKEGSAGFGVDAFDFRRLDLDEPVQLVRDLEKAGCLDLLNITSASLNLRAPLPERYRAPKADFDRPDEHPLQVLSRQLEIAGTMRAVLLKAPVVGSGFSWLRHFVPEVAAGAVKNRWIDFAGLGRAALAYPDLPATLFHTGRIEPRRTCMICFACTTLEEDAQPVGCVIRDPEIYGPIYQRSRQFAPDRLADEARRCHFCEMAPCVRACPTHTDIPGFIKAYLDGDPEKAYEIIRRQDPLPETTSRLSPAWLESEGACIETALTARPIPILDLQYAISWEARIREGIGVKFPAASNHRKVAIVGAGPAGLAAAIRLLELGYEVEIFEEAEVLGGTPRRVIPRDRLPDTTPEIEGVLAPAIGRGRLRIHQKTSLGRDISLDELRTSRDAVLLACGLWRERSIDGKKKTIGVTNGLRFLEEVKSGDRISIPRRVALLAGGDSAMDAAGMARKLGPEELFIVFGGPRSEMHWHRPDAWFATPGVHALMLCEPLGYEKSGDGRLHGLRIRHREFDHETVLKVDLVIEAMGLEPAGELVAMLGGKPPASGEFRTALDSVYAAGGLTNGGASVVQCVAEGRDAAECIHSDFVP